MHEFDISNTVEEYGTGMNFLPVALYDYALPFSNFAYCKTDHTLDELFVSVPSIKSIQLYEIIENVDVPGGYMWWPADNATANYIPQIEGWTGSYPADWSIEEGKMYRILLYPNSPNTETDLIHSTYYSADIAAGDFPPLPF